MGKHKNRPRPASKQTLEELIDPQVAKQLKKEELKQRDMERLWRQHGHFTRTFGGDSDRRFGRK